MKKQQRWLSRHSDGRHFQAGGRSRGKLPKLVVPRRYSMSRPKYRLIKKPLEETVVEVEPIEEVPPEVTVIDEDNYDEYEEPEQEEFQERVTAFKKSPSLRQTLGEIWSGIKGGGSKVKEALQGA